MLYFQKTCADNSEERLLSEWTSLSEVDCHVQNRGRPEFQKLKEDWFCKKIENFNGFFKKISNVRFSNAKK